MLSVGAPAGANQPWGIPRTDPARVKKQLDGEPSASITTTPAGVTTKPALEMKFWLAGEPRADRPSTYQQWGATSRGTIGGATASASVACA